MTQEPRTLRDRDAWAAQLGISREAIDVYATSDVIDLHVDSFIWARFGYDLTQRHGHGLFGARFYGHADFPRILEAGVTSAMWSITTNPLRSARSRAQTFERNLARLKTLFAQQSERFALVTNRAEHDAARAAGKHAAMIAIQGGNALDVDDAALDCLRDGSVMRITLVHLSRSQIGQSSSPLRLSDHGLGARGTHTIKRLNELRVLVDLAHISPESFKQAVLVHDRSLPLICTHTGVSGVYRSWRNLDDWQIRAIADSGGTIGIIFHSPYLEGRYFGGRAEALVDHMQHVIDLVGDDHVSLGSDWDGAIITPRDMPTCLELPRLVQHMLGRGFNDESIRKILGGNFLRVLRQLRG
jgi:membrane dipeptidase